MVGICECCGHPIPTFDTLSGLTPMQQRIFEIVRKAGQAGLTRPRIFEKLYSDDIDGGPLHMNVINVQKTKMKDALATHGLKLTGTGGHNSIWRLEKL